MTVTVRSLKSLAEVKGLRYWSDEHEVRGDDLDDYVDLGEADLAGETPGSRAEDAPAAASLAEIHAMIESAESQAVIEFLTRIADNRRVGVDGPARCPECGEVPGGG